MSTVTETSGPLAAAAAVAANSVALPPDGLVAPPGFAATIRCSPTRSVPK